MSSAELTLRTYAHVVPRDEDSLEFLPSSAGRGGKRGGQSEKKRRRRKWPTALRKLERKTGFEPATLNLGSRKKPQE